MGYIKYFDAHFTNFTGGVDTTENCVCLHEEDYGILWKHQDWRTGLAEVRRSRRLTVSFICTVANYEYGFYWHFYQASRMHFPTVITCTDFMVALGLLLVVYFLFSQYLQVKLIFNLFKLFGAGRVLDL